MAIKAIVVGVLMAVLGGQMAAPAILAGVTAVAGKSWFGSWFAGQAMPAVLVAGVAIMAGVAVARVSGTRARLGVASYAAFAAASGVPQLMTQFSNAAQDSRYASGAWGMVGNMVLALACVVLGGWLGAGPNWGQEPARDVVPPAGRPGSPAA